MDTAFYVPDGAGFAATPLTRGPWDVRFQHGGPPSALVCGALARWGTDSERWFLSRLTIELLRPVPLGHVTVSVEPGRLGRSVQRLGATLHVDGRPVMTALGLRIRRADMPVPAVPRPEPWPAPDTLPRLRFDFFRHPVGYHNAVQMHCASGAWGVTPIGVWGRPRVPLVAGRPDLPRERVLVLADAQSGM
ncbi:MAG: acyl-CoA thioesterase domain-containing protein, partial [Myxococcota bacterium]|nr:acyl-CoA thioesterase domain-containing protein [Myxococcota bacterium]